MTDMDLEGVVRGGVVAMTRLLFTVVGAEAVVVVLLVVKTPLQRLVLLALDPLKRGRGPVAFRTVAFTVAVFLMLTLYSMGKIQSRAGGKDGIVGLSPTDQVLWSRHLLETSLMGYLLVLALVIDRVHHYIRELHVLTKGMEAVTEQKRVAEDGKYWASEALKAHKQESVQLNAKIARLKLESEAKVKEVVDRASKELKACEQKIIQLNAKIAKLELESEAEVKEVKDGASKELKQLNAKIAKLELESEAEVKEVKTAQANALALSKQTEGLLIEYDRLLEENQNLRTQLKSIDCLLSRSDNKKTR